MRGHVKASSAGSNVGAGNRRAHLGIVFACLCTLVALAAGSASAAVPGKGVTGFFGASGEAAGKLSAPRGVAVRQSNGNVYVVDGANNRISVFDANGSFLRAFGRDVVAFGPDQADEVQSVAVAATSGKFTLGFEGNATAELLPTATAAEVQAALNALPTISRGGGSVSVSGGPGDASGSSPYRILFNAGPLKGLNVAQIGVANISLSGGASATAIASGTLIDGEVGFEICSSIADDTCRSGTTGSGWGAFGPNIQGIAINQASGDVYVTDQGNQRIQQFDASGNFLRAFGSDVVETGFPGDSPPASAVQTLSVTATGGKYVLSFQGQATGELSFNATAAEIETALQGLSSIGTGNATVSETSSGTFQITFAGRLANSPEPLVTAASGAIQPLSGGIASVAATTAGSTGFEVCSASSNTVCQSGTTTASLSRLGGAFGAAMGYPEVAPVGAPNAGDLLVPDPSNRRLQEFGSSGAFVRAFGFDVAKGGPGNTGTGFEICAAASFDACEAGTAGAGSGQFADATPTGVAEDSAGNLYAVEPTTNFRIQKFTLPGNLPTPQGNFAEGSTKGTSATNAPVAVAIDPSSSNVLATKAFEAGATPACPVTGGASVAERRVLELTPAGSLEGVHATCAGLNSVSGLGARGSSGNLYLSSSTTNDQPVYVLNTGQPVAPIVSITNVSGIGGHEATINALVNPGGPELPYGQETTYKLEYKRSSDSNYSTYYNAEASAGNRAVAKSLTLQLSGLLPNSSYDARLTAVKGLGSGSASQTVSFQTSPSAPDVAITDFVAMSGSKVRLAGTVNPNGQATGYHFDYVDQAAFEASGFASAESVPSGSPSAGSGSSSTAVSVEVSGLSFSTTYHYRLVASNGVGDSSAVGIFTTPANPADCPNAQLRSEQTSEALPGGTAYLPRCMALEMVTPASKFNQYTREGQFSNNGNRVIFRSLAAFDSPLLGSILDEYIASRGPDEWRSTATAAPLPYTTGNVATGAPCAISPDFSSWNTWTSTQVQAKLAITTVFNHTIDGSFTPLSPTLIPTNSGASVFSVNNSACLGGSADNSHFLVSLNEAAYLPGDLASSVYDTFLNESGEPTIALLQRDKNGVVVGGGCGARIQGESHRGVMSSDGSITYFTSRAGQQSAGCDSSNGIDSAKSRILRRILTPSGPEIVQASASECTRISPACDLTDGPDTFQGATQEGDRVFFTSNRQLANSDLDVGAGCTGEMTGFPGCDLYMADAGAPVGARLTQISRGEADAPTPGRGAEVLGHPTISGDGSHAYFVARGVLTTAPNQYGRTPQAGHANLYAYSRDGPHPAGDTSFIGTLESSDSTLWHEPNGNRSALAVPLLGSDVEDMNVGGDGHILVFLSSSPLTPDDLDGGHTDLFRYDSDTGSLERVSKADPGGSDNGAFDVSPSGIVGSAREGTFERATLGEAGAATGHLLGRGRKVSEDGRTIAFVTAEALSPLDTNGVENPYIYSDGELAPLPIGKVPNVDLSGRSVLFQTGQRLLAQDGDTAQDIYVARALGGYPVPHPSIPCQGERCQEPFQPQAGESGAATEAAGGAGNVVEKPSKRPCGKGKARRRGKCVKKQRQKRHGTRHKQRAKSGANHEQGGRK